MPMIKTGYTVTVRATVITNQNSEGWFKAEIGRKVYTLHKTSVVTIDPRPFQKGDIVGSTLEHRIEMSGVVLCVEDEQAWVRWDDHSKAIESISNLTLLRPSPNPLGLR